MKYKIAFYENGAFASYLGTEFDDVADAMAAYTAYFLNVSAAGLTAEQHGPMCFTYDRYGTPCAVKIEET